MVRRYRSHVKRVATWVFIVAGLIAVGVVIAVANRRSNITDPAILADIPGRDLRDAEVETLVRTAFRYAKEVTVESEGSPGRTPWRRVAVKDKSMLDSLADSFAVGHDESQLPEYPYPGVMYTTVRFEDPYRPDFVFIEPQEIYVYSRRMVKVRTQFVRAIGDLLELDAQSNGGGDQDRTPDGD